MRIDNTLSLFAEALTTVMGRLIGFGVTTLLGAMLSYLAFHGATSFSDLAWLPVLWATGIATGAFQLWGLLTYTVLAIAFVCLVHYEWDPVTCLAFAFVVQVAETFRCLIVLDGPGRLDAARTVALAVVWGLVLMLWILRVLASRHGWVALGPLGLLIGAPLQSREELDEDEVETDEPVVWEDVDLDKAETTLDETS